jgi:hypothetical protein
MSSENLAVEKAPVSIAATGDKADNDFRKNFNYPLVKVFQSFNIYVYNLVKSLRIWPTKCERKR